MTQGKIDRLEQPASTPRIQIRQGSSSASDAQSSMLLNTNSSLILPGGSSSRRAYIYFLDSANRLISGYRVRISSSSTSGQYRIPCTITGRCTLSWDQGNSSGCREVIVRGMARSPNRSASFSTVGQPSAQKRAESRAPLAMALTTPTPLPRQHQAIQALIERGIITGYRGGRIEPDALITREEFASMIAAANFYWKVAETTRSLQFSDIAADRWSRKAIELAVRTGFLSGYPGGLFKPTQSISYEQALASLAGGLGLSSDTSVLSQYQDANTLSAWARLSVSAAIKANIVVSSDERVLNPQHFISRGEAATLIYQALVYKEEPQNLQVFEQPDAVDPDDPLDPGPEVRVAPRGGEVTLVYADAGHADADVDGSGVIRINSLTSTVNIIASPALGSPTLTQYLDFGQRYTWEPDNNGHYQGHLSVISRVEREAIATSEDIQSFIDGWSSEVKPLPKAIYQNLLANRLLKKTPVQAIDTTLQGTPLWKVTIDLSDPDTLLTIGLGGGATQETATNYSSESFDQLMQRYSGAALLSSGTFFNPNTNELYGNMIATGQFLRYKGWESDLTANRGTVLFLGEGNRPAMLTSDSEGDRIWQDSWRDAWFYLTAGPRLLRAGTVALNPTAERFVQSTLTDVDLRADRAAIGFSQDRRTLYLVMPKVRQSLTELATLMKAIGCYEAMNLDGGASRALAVNGTVKVPAGRPLSHVLAIYDVNHPAPPAFREAWEEYQKGDRRPQLPSPMPSSAPPTPPTPISGSINQRIVQALSTKGYFSTLNFVASTPGAKPGDNSCGWAVNQVLAQAGLQLLDTYVPQARILLNTGRGALINPAQAQPGDIVISAKDEHMGICFAPNRVRSSSASKDLFCWESDLNFDNYFGSEPSSIYRLKS